MTTFTRDHVQVQPGDVVYRVDRCGVSAVIVTQNRVDVGCVLTEQRKGVVHAVADCYGDLTQAIQQVREIAAKMGWVAE